MSVAQLERTVRAQVAALPPARRSDFLRRLAGLLEDFSDVAAVDEQRGEPTRPWAQVRSELTAARGSVTR